jgi:hypothetical protein
MVPRLTRRTPRTAAVVIALVAILTPWVVDVGIAIHVAIEAGHGHDPAHHHDDADAPLPSAIHGHTHDAGTPAHDHGSSLPEGPSRAPRTVTVTWSAGGLAVLPSTDAPWRTQDSTAAPPSPPTVSTTILRI